MGKQNNISKKSLVSLSTSDGTVVNSTYGPNSTIQTVPLYDSKTNTLAQNASCSHNQTRMDELLYIKPGIHESCRTLGMVG